MAGKDKTTAWENVKWIKAHLPSWEKKGMTERFLKSIISPKYKGCEVDVGSAITCDICLFETLYNQPDFLEKLKEICKKYRMPYGRVSKEDEKKAEDDIEIKFKDFCDSKVVSRAENGKLKRADDLQKRLDSVGYTIENKIANLDELSEIIERRKESCIAKNGEKTGIANYSWSPLLIELYIDFIERHYDKYQMAQVLGQSPQTPLKYIAELKAANIIKNLISKQRGYYVANEDIVKFVNGHKRKIFTPEWEW